MPDNFSFTESEKPLDIEEIIISEETPIINPTILNIVEKEINLNLYFDRRCLIAMRVVNFIYLLAVMQGIRLHP